MKVRLIRKTISLVVVGVLWLTMSALGWADVRIVTQYDNQQSEVFIKNNRIIMPAMGVGTLMLHCDSMELALVSFDTSRYWKGQVGDLQKALDDVFDGFAQEIPSFDGMADVGAMLDGLLGGAQQSGEVRVRVTKVAETTIAGYSADHYRVETGTDNRWRTYEEIWISEDLMQVVREEVGGCVDTMLEFFDEMSLAGPIGSGETAAVMASPDYQSLMGKGFPVRNESSMTMFGMTINSVSQVIEVSRDPISEGIFAVPSNFRRVNSPIELFGM